MLSKKGYSEGGREGFLFLFEKVKIIFLKIFFIKTLKKFQKKISKKN
jgi:hypothetical protein